MAKETTFYNIHNILKIQINSEKKFDLMKGLDLELFPFKTTDVSSPDIVFNVGLFNASNEGCSVVDYKYFVKPNYFYCNDSSDKATWEIEIFGFEEGNMVVNFNYTSNIWSAISRISVETMLLPSIIYQKLYEKDYYLIHAAGVNNGNCCYILPGRGGIFKTSLVMDFIRHKGFEYLGDDRVLLHKNNVLNYPASIVLFDYIYSHKENEFINFWDKIKFISNLWFSSKNRDNYNISTPISGPGKMNAMFFGSKVSGIDTVAMKKISKEDAIKKLLASNKLEISYSSKSPYHRYMQAYSYVFTDSDIANYWINFEKSLEKLISDIPLYEIQYPSTYNISTFKQVCSIIEGI